MPGVQRRTLYISRRVLRELPQRAPDTDIASLLPIYVSKPTACARDIAWSTQRIDATRDHQRDSMRADISPRTLIGPVCQTERLPSTEFSCVVIRLEFIAVRHGYCNLQYDHAAFVLVIRAVVGSAMIRWRGGDCIQYLHRK